MSFGFERAIAGLVGVTRELGRRASGDREGHAVPCGGEIVGWFLRMLPHLYEVRRTSANTGCAQPDPLRDLHCVRYTPKGPTSDTDSQSELRSKRKVPATEGTNVGPIEVPSGLEAPDNCGLPKGPMARDDVGNPRSGRLQTRCLLRRSNARVGPKTGQKKFSEGHLGLALWRKKAPRRAYGRTCWVVASARSGGEGWGTIISGGDPPGHLAGLGAPSVERLVARECGVSTVSQVISPLLAWRQLWRTEAGSRSSSR